MSRIPARLLTAVVAVALVVPPVAATSSAAAATRPAHRDTIAMVMAGLVGWAVGMLAESEELDGRSASSVREVIEILKVTSVAADGFKTTITGLTDRNHDGLDDDAKIKVRVFDNVATVILRKNYNNSVVDSGFVLHNRFSVLKESAQSYDRMVRWAAGLGVDTWDMSSPQFLRHEMPSGVRLVSEYDGNDDGYDDDGRLTFLANGKAVTLTIGNTRKEIGKVTYGPTWRTKAPKRTHHPLPRPRAMAPPAPSSSRRFSSNLTPSARVVAELRHVQGDAIVGLAGG
jgi:hypothetical protein